MHTLATIALFVGDTTSKSPGVPGIGAIIAWWICARNKRNPIGGWLQYFYWSLYGGFLISLLFLAMNTTSYVPEYSGSTRDYLLFLSSAVPMTVMLFVQLIIATFLLIVRTPEMLRLVRWTWALSALVVALGMAIDYLYNPVNMALGALSLISDICWLIYLLRSERVKHVFEMNDWDVAVLSMYPVQPSLSS